MVRKKSKRKNYKSGTEKAMIFVLIAVIAVGAYFMFFRGTPDDPGEVDIGTEVPAYVDDDGDCVGREGIEMGMCCGVWNTETEEVEWVLCEDLVDNQADVSQAFMSFEGGDRVSGIASMMFVVRLTNTGTYDADVKINSVVVTAVSGGDTASINEIQSAFDQLLGQYRTVAPAAHTDFSMNYNVDYIRLDIPSGSSAFTMTDGTYQIAIGLTAIDDQGQVIDAGSRTVSMIVEQEVVSFSIDVIPSS